MEISSTNVLHQTNFLSLYERVVVRGDKTSKYFFVSRGDGVVENKYPDAVIVVGFINGNLVLTNEYRIPIGGREIGFPAGLIDKKDRPVEVTDSYQAMQQSAKNAAVREFREETGLVFSAVEASPPNLISTAGMSDESVCVVHGVATGTPSKKFMEKSEDIETLLLSRDQLVSFMSKNRLPYGKHAWAMLWAFREFGYPKWACKP
jgi:ADP-ribose pyrophosphatase